MAHRNAWRDPHREIEALCALRDRLPRRVVFGVDLEVYTMNHGDLVAVATLKDGCKRIDYAQGVLEACDFPVFAARHIAAAYDAQLRRAARRAERKAA
ncbi:hypothetical protein [Methyloceanibacter caenitepidi]|uniref:Uncharacterized protein n=1 Tax=Methyloceanibacter caenitepidi TaxID=1384459 RepID=A0A0A8K334_9HYPH|nr:hypothetical protein [Methyloceanibacter caenitepidi]BAQ16932.1 hypothetical protein GL4_1476 [Methyloceanibacter caenitepidi]